MKKNHYKAMLGAMALAGMALSSASTQAADYANRVQRIQETNTFTIAYREGAVPFSYLIAKDQPVGMGIDISNKIAEELKKRTGNADLVVRYQPVTTSTRLPMIVTGSVDIECAQTTNTNSRQDLVNFSHTFYVSEGGIAVRRSAEVNNYYDLKDKKVAVAAGTTTEAEVKSIASDVGFTVVSARSNAVGMFMLTDGQVDAFIAAKPILTGVAVSQTEPGEVKILGTGSSLEAFGCMLPNGDTEFKALVDDVLVGMMGSGEMEKLHNKWFNAPIPPKDITLGLEINEATAAAYQNPNDKAL